MSRQVQPSASPGSTHRLGWGWDGPHGSTDGPRPPLALVAAWLYAVTGLAILASGIVSTVIEWRTEGLESLGVFLPISLYCAGLCIGAVQLRSRLANSPASPWICAPLLLHGLSGLAGIVLPLAYSIGVCSKSLSDFGSGSAMFGMLLGWLPALCPFLFARRAGVLLLAAFSGPVALIVVVQSVHIRI